MTIEVSVGAAGVEGCTCRGCEYARIKASRGIPPEGTCGSCDSPAETCELLPSSGGGHSNGWCRRCLERAGHVLPRGDA